MKIDRLEIPDVVLISPKIFGDSRGFFLESYNQRNFESALGLSRKFVQDNHSRSSKGVLRGIHFQLRKPQGKLVRVVRGEVFDVAVDLRRSSPHFGRWVGAILSEGNQQQLWIPEGFGHGFVTLSESADFLYKATDYYDPSDEHCLLWNDPSVGIAWPKDATPQLSAKDLKGLRLDQLTPFP